MTTAINNVINKLVNKKDLGCYWKPVGGNVYDIFQGSGWDNWCRVAVKHGSDNKTTVDYIAGYVPLKRENFFRFINHFK